MRTRRLLSAAILLPLLAACSMSSSTDAPSSTPSSMPSSTAGATADPAVSATAQANPALADDAIVTYRFTDSSVPPQYHRSWTLTVTKELSEIAVDSYGDALGGGVAETTPEVWAALADGLPAVQALSVSGDTEGCTGGTGEAATVQSGSEVLLDISVYECAGVDAEVAEALRTWIAPARDQFPPTDELAPPGQE